MSKFTKALEKIQVGREEVHLGKKPTASSKFQVGVSASLEEAGTLDRGVTNVKNTVPDSRIVMLRFPDSMLAEQYRMFRTTFKSQLAEAKARVILVSSSMHSEGKTVTAANLAVALAENGESKVALVDADLRRGNAAEYLGFGNKRRGLTELLSENLAPKQVMCRNSLKNFVVIPRGAATRKSSDLVSSVKLQYLLAELKHQFDYVIMDSPPIMSVADAGILGREVDGVLFVIQAGRTPKSVISHAQVLFKQAGAKVLGYVLTNVEYQSADYKYYNYYDEYKVHGQNRAQIHIRKAGFGFKDFEEKFNRWWEKRVLKKGKKSKDSEHRTKEESSPEVAEAPSNREV